MRAVLIGAASYAALFVLLLWQALRGSSLAAPDGTALASLAIWAVSTADRLRRASLPARDRRPHDGPKEMTA